MTTRTAFTTCSLCEACCGLEIAIVEGVVKRIRGDRDHVMSHGYICPKGSTLKHLHEDPDRLRGPVKRVGDDWVEIGWDRAFAEIAERFDAVVAEHGRQSLAMYLGNPNVHHFENALAIRPLAKALGTRHIYSAATVDQMPKQVACGYMYGHPANLTVPDLDRADFLLMLGANPYESNGSLCTAPDFPGRLEAIRARGGTVVVVDPRRTKTAQNADRWIPIRPGTDAALLVGLIKVLFTESLVDLGPVGEMVAGLDEVAAAVDGFDLEDIARWTAVPIETIRDLAFDLASAPSAAVYSRIGTHTVTFGTTASWAVEVLNVVTGNLDRPGGVMFPLAAHQAATRKTRPFGVGRWQSRVRGLPEVMGELPVVVMAEEMTIPGEGQIRVLFTIGGNPVITNPGSEELDQAMGGLDLMVSVDPYLNATTRHAHYILPPPSPLERSHYDLAFTTLAVRNYAHFSAPVFDNDTMSEFEILVMLTAIASGFGAEADPKLLAEASLAQLISQAVSDPDSAVHGMDPGDIIAMLGNRPAEERMLDFTLRTGSRGDGFGRNPGGVALDLLEANPHGIDFGPLEPRIPAVLATASQRVELAPPQIIADLGRLRAAMGPAADGLRLVGRRQLRTVNSWLTNVEVVIRGREPCALEVNPKDAERLGVEDGAMVEVTTDQGSVAVPVEVTEDIAEGVVSLPYGWGHDYPGSRQSVASTRPGVNVNRLTDRAAYDPLSGNAVLNGIPVTVVAAT